MTELLFDGIKVYDYLEPIRRFNEYYKKISVSYYKDILKKYKNIKVLTEQHEDIFLQYVKCRPNCKVIIVFENHNVNEFIDRLKKDGIYYYHKTVDMKLNEVASLMYQLLYDECSTFSNLMKYIVKLGFEDNNRLDVYFYEEKDVEIESDLYHFVNDTFKELVLMSSIFLNKNSLELLKYQNVEKLYEFSDTLCKKTFGKLIRESYKDLSLLELNNYLITSSFILYLYGFRSCSDIDIKYIYIDKDYIKKFLKEDYVDINRAPNVDIVIKYNDDKYISYYDMIIDPKYHLYFLGYKVITLDVEMKKKRYRDNRPRAFVDIIYVNEKLNRKYELPKMDNIGSTFYKTMKFMFKKRYNLNYEMKYIKELIKKYNNIL